MRAPNVLTISPALPFLETFVAALMNGDVIGPVERGLALADMTIYVPTRRAAQALADVFLRQAETSALVLPRILPLGALESTETELFLEESDAPAEPFALPAAASALWRRFQLAALIHSWAKAVGGAICRVTADGTPVIDLNEAFRVATSPVDAFALAGELAGLIDEMQIENVAWRELDELQMAAFDDYWRITTTFLSIAVEHWPQVLAERGLVDPTARQIALLDAQTHRLSEDRGARPVIAIGSTGTNRATARLLAAVARAQRGAVVLPGLDQDLDDGAWTLISGRIGEGQEPSFGHPQAALARLLPTLGIARADVKPLGAPAPAAALRAALVSEALRPSDTTDHWRLFRRSHPQKEIASGLAGISLVEAADEREEALCIAVALRQVLETPGRTAALITPDRELARRVRGELLRWNVEVDDTGGEPLAVRPLGILARLVAAAGASRLAPRDVCALLTHPLASFGRTRQEVAQRASQLEIAVLNVIGQPDDTRRLDFDTARALAGDPHAHPAQRSLSAADWVAIEDLWTIVTEALAPLTALEGTKDLTTWVTAHRAALAMILGSTEGEDMERLESLFDEIEAGSASALALNAGDYATLIGRLLGELVCRNTKRAHPCLQILGLLEARLLRADLVILGGLDETIWPPPARTDPFLNRPMRQALGLTPPERRLGQTAHDFEQAMGNAQVILSRALKRGGAPTVASRLLLRLEALTGEAWKTCRERGTDIVKLARMLDKAQKAPVPIKRPRPTPPVALRPRRLSVTQIETLRRDPYAIYAAKILRLAPLPRHGGELDARAFGERVHAALQNFARCAEASIAHQRREALLGCLRQAFEDAAQDPSFGAVRWPLLCKAADVFLAFDGRQRETLRDMLIEVDGRLDFALADLSPFTLHARADRIDLHRDGSATLIDYKTGQPPGNREVFVGFAPQLTLEAAILNGGGFGLVHEAPIRAFYLKLSGKDGGKAREVTFDNETFLDVTARHMEGLRQLLSSFREEATGYPSRPFPKYAKRRGDYDHLARVREWSLSADDEILP